MITLADFKNIMRLLGDQAQLDIGWSEGLLPPESARDFAAETIYVICNSGMQNKVARKIFDKVMVALHEGKSAATVFGHKGKTGAIDTVWKERGRLYREFIEAADKVAYCASLPWIGGITKYHLAKNFGVDCAKPDVHLKRLADREGVSAQQLCERLAREAKLRVATVDVVLWRACAEGVLDSRTGTIHAARAERAPEPTLV